jgi:hypothetical protein
MLLHTRRSTAEKTGKRMQARVWAFLAGCLCIGLVEPAAAARGTVIWKHQNCAFFILQTARDYALLEWLAGALPQVGDDIDGDFRGKGTLEFHNRTADLPLTALVAARSQRRADVEKSIPPRCN